MRAAAINEPGGPEVLQVMDLPTPTPAPDQMLVQVKAAGVQPADCQIRRGRRIGNLEVKYPQILGNEFAGVVVEVGPEVTGFQPGDEVLGWAMLASYAEYVAVGTDQIVRKPAGMPWEEAGVLSASGQSAMTALRDLNVGPGDTVLIHAAAGGVGTMAVQLARHMGANVIGTASERNHDYLRSLGATPVVYGPGLVDRVKALAPNGVDAALDAVGGEAVDASIALVSDRKRIATLVEFSRVEELGILGIQSRRSVEQLGELTSLYEQGKLKVSIWKKFTLDQAADAHREVETGHVRGKVVIMIE